MSTGELKAEVTPFKPDPWYGTLCQKMEPTITQGGMKGWRNKPSPATKPIPIPIVAASTSLENDDDDGDDEHLTLHTAVPCLAATL